MNLPKENPASADCCPLLNRWASEPFRVFFPLGALAGMVGTMLLAAFFLGWLPFYPGLMHPRIMIHGFAGAFITGFLATAWPRFLETKHLGKGELLLLLLLWLAATTVACWPTKEILADRIFATQQGALVLILLRRLPKAQDSPPPGFVLAILSIFLAIPALLLATEFPRESALYLRYVYWLLPILGVASYLAPRFFQPTPPKVSPRVRRWMLLGVSLVIFLSLALELREAMAWSYGLRALALFVWCLTILPGGWIRGGGTRGFALQLALWSLPFAYLIKAFWPGPAYALSHLIFLVGLGTTVLLIADRVSQNHSDSPRPMRDRSPLWRWLFGLIVVTAATRISADLIPKVMISHYIYAAISWSLVLLLWCTWHWKHWRK